MQTIWGVTQITCYFFVIFNLTFYISSVGWGNLNLCWALTRDLSLHLYHIWILRRLELTSQRNVHRVMISQLKKTSMPMIRKPLFLLLRLRTLEPTRETWALCTTGRKYRALVEVTVEEEGMLESGVCEVCKDREPSLQCCYYGPWQFFCSNCARDLHADRNQFLVLEQWKVSSLLNALLAL